MSALASLDSSQPRLALTTAFAAWKGFLLAIALGSSVASDYDTSTSLFFERVYGSGADVPALAAKLTRWDALYFVHAARHGYVYEQEWAFSTGLTTFIEFVVNVGQSLGFSANAVAEPVIGIIIAHVSHLIAVLALYQFAVVVSKDHRLAFVAAALHIISPAGLFLSAPYAESPFTCLTFVGNLLFAVSQGEGHGVARRDLAQIAAGVVFGLSTTLRSNGLLSGLLFAVEATTRLVRFKERPSLATLLRMIAPVIGGLFIAVGALAPQVVAWQRYCRPDAEELEPRPWCARTIPSIYSFVQEHYWNVGFLRYWTPEQIPLFLLAAPMLAILLKSGLEVAQQPTTRFAVTQPYQKLVRTLAVGQFVLAQLALTNYHVQIISRLSSAYPVWYIWFAGLLLNKQTQDWGRRIAIFMAMYAGVQGGLFASFLPPA